MGQKPVLVKIDDNVWSAAKRRASALPHPTEPRSLHVHEFVEQALVAHLVHTQPAAVSSAARIDMVVQDTYSSTVANYVTTTDLPSTTAAETLGNAVTRAINNMNKKRSGR